MLPNYQISGNERFPITEKTLIRIHQEQKNSIDIEKKFSEFNNEMRVSILEDIYSKNEQIIQDKELKIKLLEDQILKLKSVQLDTLPLHQLNRELLHQFDMVDKFSYAKSIEVSKVKDSVVTDTIPTFLLKFKNGYKWQYRNKMRAKVQEWLKVRLNDDKARAVEYY